MREETVRADIRAGQLRKPVTLQQLTQTPDGSLGFTQSWSTFRNCWAAIEPLSGAERLEFAQLDPTLSIRITIRYTAGVSPKMRAVYLTHTYEIVAVLETQMAHKELVLMCHELETP